MSYLSTVLITDMLYFLLACLIPHPGAVNDEVVRKGRASKEKKARASYRGKGKGKASASKSSRVAVSGSARRAPVNSTRSKRGQRSRLNRLFAKSIRCSEERGVAAKAHSKDVAVALSRSGRQHAAARAKGSKRRKPASDEEAEDEVSLGEQLLSRMSFGFSSVKFW